MGAVTWPAGVEIEGEGKSPVWRQDSLALVNPLWTPALGFITALSRLPLDPLNASTVPGLKAVKGFPERESQFLGPKAEA